jgi:hypothetical protein
VEFAGLTTPEICRSSLRCHHRHDGKSRIHGLHRRKCAITPTTSSRMMMVIITICRRCANSLLTESQTSLSHRSIATTRPLISRRMISIFPFNRYPLRRRQTLQLSAPDPFAPVSQCPEPIQRDPGLTLGEHGIPVPPTRKTRRDYTDEKAWAETVFRTLSGGMKSDYLKCTRPPSRHHHLSTTDSRYRHRTR